MVISFFFGGYSYWPEDNSPKGFRIMGFNLMLFVLLFLLGWGIFGFVVKGPGGP